MREYVCVWVWRVCLVFAISSYLLISHASLCGVYVRLSVCVCASVRCGVHGGIQMPPPLHTHTHTHAGVHAPIHLHSCVRVCACARACSCLRARTRFLPHARTHRDTHTHTHTHLALMRGHQEAPQRYPARSNADAPRVLEFKLPASGEAACFGNYPHQTVQPRGPSSPLLLRRIWNFAALNLHRHSFRQIACQRASMAWTILYLAPSRHSTRQHPWWYWCNEGSSEHPQSHLGGSSAPSRRRCRIPTPCLQQLRATL